MESCLTPRNGTDVGATIENTSRPNLFDLASSQLSTLVRENCGFCESNLSRACEATADGKAFYELDVPWRSVYGVEDLSQGTIAGCHDCALILKAARCYNKTEISAVELCLNMQSNDEKGPELNVVLKMSWPGVPAKDVSLSVMSDTVQESDRCSDIFHTDSMVCGRNTLNTAYKPESHYDKISRGSIVSQDTSSKSAFDYVTKQISICVRNHIICNKRSYVQLPKRVLEIGENHVFLREQPEMQAKYACLSHCWGKYGAALQLLTKTLQAFKSGVAKSTLPNTFKDAVEICSALGLHFIWIDAMCIIQDDRDDWEDAATNMANIYEDAFITIAASWSHDSNGGCFSQSRLWKDQYRLSDTGLYVRALRSSFGQPTHDWPLLERGWVLQERLLSPRVVHYAKDQIFWECRALFQAEDGIQKLERDSQPGLHMNAALKFVDDYKKASWTKLVTQYTSLRLTKESDRLPALAGVVERMMDHRKDDLYIAGMWRSTFLTDLAFYSDHGSRSETIAPSWSWASVQGKSRFIPIRLLNAVNLLGFEFRRVSSAHVGMVEDARVRLRGSVLLGTVHPNWEFEADSVQDLDLDHVTDMRSSQCPDYITIYTTPLMDQSYDHLPNGTTLTILLLGFDGFGRIIGVSLQEVENGHGWARKFKRLGLVRLKCAGKYHTELEKEALQNFSQTLPVRELEII